MPCVGPSRFYWMRVVLFCFILCLFLFWVEFLCHSQVIGSEDRLRNDVNSVDWDVKLTPTPFTCVLQWMWPKLTSVYTHHQKNVTILPCETNTSSSDCYNNNTVMREVHFWKQTRHDVTGKTTNRFKAVHSDHSVHECMLKGESSRRLLVIHCSRSVSCRVAMLILHLSTSYQRTKKPNLTWHTLEYIRQYQTYSY